MSKHLIKAGFTATLALSAMLATAVSVQAIELTEAQRAAIAARISPEGSVCVEGESCGGMPGQAVASTAAAGGAPAVDGEATYNGACMACHSTGAGGAPMVGNEEAWAPRIAKGMDALYNSGLNGVAGGAMLAKGGRADLSDAAVKAAVDYMVSNSQ